MGAQENRLTLEGLAQRLETLERENERIRSENADLHSKVARLEGSGTLQSEVAELRGSNRHHDREAVAAAFEGQVSRRSLLSKAGAAAVAAVAAGTLLDPREAKANHFPNGIFQANSVWTHQLLADTDDLGTAVHGAASYEFGAAVSGHNRSRGGYGVQGSSSGGGGTGVWGITTVTEGTGVRGEGDTGMWGSSSRTGWSGVYGQHTGTSGYGVVGDGTGGSAGVLGRNSSGYGGQFEGGKAQLMLVPKPAGTIGPPTGSHAKGEVYMDSAGTLFVCTVGGATPTWRRVQTAAVS
jgi:hypothetical protein